MRDNYKLVHYYFNSITVFQIFPVLGFLGPRNPPLGGGGGGGNPNPTFIFDILKIIDIGRSTYIRLKFNISAC